MKIEEKIVISGRNLGFDLLGIIPVSPSNNSQYLKQWLDDGMAGDMEWIHRGQEKREDPKKILPTAKTIIMVGINYFSQDIPQELLNDPSRGIIARYAWFDDYHEIIKSRLQQYSKEILRILGKNINSKIYVDTGPFLEREYANKSGLGFIGNNTNLINYKMGSYIFLGEILVDAEIDSYTKKVIGSCGVCRKCMDSCPTNAIVGEKKLDARKCISYLTIELKKEIPEELRPLIKNRIYGCDICQEVCPWNSKSQASSLAEFRTKKELVAPKLLDLAMLTEDEFRTRFKNSPIKRTKYKGLMRNVAVALGNWGSKEALPGIENLISNPEDLVRSHAIWAKKQILL